VTFTASQQGDRLPVRNAVRLEDREASFSATLEELEAEAALPEPGLADDADHLRVPLNRTCQRRFQSRHLVLAADEA
jgi:hypothetical protein